MVGKVVTPRSSRTLAGVICMDWMAQISIDLLKSGKVNANRLTKESSHDGSYAYVHQSSPGYLEYGVGGRR